MTWILEILGDLHTLLYTTYVDTNNTDDVELHIFVLLRTVYLRGGFNKSSESTDQPMVREIRRPRELCIRWDECLTSLAFCARG